jgi:hypothetical protein
MVMLRNSARFRSMRIVLALTYACHKSGAGWVDASNEKHVDIQPTHWRKWTERH